MSGHALEEIFRAEHGRILATLIRLIGDFDTAEEALQEAVAVALEHGLALVDALDHRGELGEYHLLPVARAELLRRLGRHAEAAESYRRALALVSNEAERRHLGRRLREIAS